MLMIFSMVLVHVRLVRNLMLTGSCTFGNRKELFEAVQQLFQLYVAGEKLFDLGTQSRTLGCGLFMGKYVIVVLHDY